MAKQTMTSGVVACVVLVVVCSAASSCLWVLLTGTVVKKVEGIAAKARGKHYKDVAAEVHAVTPDMPIYVVRQGTGQTLPGSTMALIVAVDAKGTVVDFPVDTPGLYTHAGVVAKLGDFS